MRVRRRNICEMVGDFLDGGAWWLHFLHFLQILCFVFLRVLCAVAPKFPALVHKFPYEYGDTG